MSYEIIDNFLSEENHKILHDYMMGDCFPWFYNKKIVESDDDLMCEEKYNYQFTHNFYEFEIGSNSSHLHILQPLLEKLNKKNILRIKANLNVSSDVSVAHGFHVDYLDFYGKSAVYYVNSNNGKTIFKEGLTVDAIANRLVIFDATMLHTGSSCTDEKVRCIINLNFEDN